MIVVNVDQPWAFAVCHLGCDVLNMDQPAPIDLERFSASVEFVDGRSVAVPAEDLSMSLRVLLRAGDHWDDDETGWPDNVGRPSFAYWGSRMGPVGGFVGDEWIDQPFGSIVAVVEITGCHHGSHVEPCSPWGDSTAWHWTVGEVTVLPTPIPTPAPAFVHGEPVTSPQVWPARYDLVAAVEEQSP